MTLAIAYGESGEAAPYPSLRDAIIGAIARIPDGHFIHARANTPHRTSSYREMLEMANGLAVNLRERGMRPGDGLIINVRNSEDFIPALWASALAGFVAVPLVHDIGRRFGEKGRDGVFGFVRAALKGATLITDDLHLSTSAPLDTVFLPDFAKSSRGRRNILDVPEGGKERLCLAVLTSGATGRPKMVGFKEGAVLARWWPKLPDGGSTSTFLSWSPYDHIMGLGLAAPNLKRKVHLDAKSFAANPLLWLDVMEETGATHATMTNFGVSLIVRAAEAHPERSWRLGEIRKIGVGAEPVSPALCRRFLDCLAPFGLRKDTIILGYGLTECGPVVGGGTVYSPNATPAGDERILLDRPTAGHAVRVVGEDSQILKEDCVGAIEVRGPTMCSGYIGDAAETGRLFTSDGWLRTGDLGVLKEGRLAVIGREKELIVVNARKYSCQEIEEAVKERSNFAEVYAAPMTGADPARDPSRGKPFVVVVAVDDLGNFQLADVAAAVRGILASAYRFAPEAVALIDRRDVPRTPLGKVQRLQLAESIEDPQFENQVHRLNSQPPPLGERRADDETERAVAGVWKRFLNLPEDFDRDADFFALGGDSVLALQLSLSLEQKFGFALPFEKFSERVSVFEITRYVTDRLRAGPAGCWVPPAQDDERDTKTLPDSVAAKLHSLLRSWPGTPVLEGGFLRRVGAAKDGVPVFWCLQSGEQAEQLGRMVGAHRPALAMRSFAFLIEYGTPAAKAIARRYADEIKESFPSGPYVIAGTCQGAIIALDVARELMSDGRKVQALIIADTPPFELFQNAAFEAPVVAYVGSRSKFNPYRKYRYPAQGLKKRLPGGCRMTVIPAHYAEIMKPGPFARVVADLDQAIAWSERASSAPSGLAPGVYPNPAYPSRILASVSELKLAPGEAADLDLTLLNGGPTDWEPFDLSGITVGNHWLSTDGEMLVWSDGRTPLTETVAAASEGTARLKITAPARTGSYLVEVDLIEEGVQWFSESRLSPLHIPVVIEEKPASAVRPSELPAEGRVHLQGGHGACPAGLGAVIRDMSTDIRASSLPGWRKISAKFALSLAKRALRL
jgi:acyl-CoA synthetase (AMP-forming)/AMP-acid ligase II/acyl carrier protein